MIVELAGRRVAPLICFASSFRSRGVRQRSPEPTFSYLSANMHPFYIDHEIGSVARHENRLTHLYTNSSAGATTSFVGGSRAISPRRDLVEASRGQRGVARRARGGARGLDQRTDYPKLSTRPAGQVLRDRVPR